MSFSWVGLPIATAVGVSFIAGFGDLNWPVAIAILALGAILGFIFSKRPSD